jgi:hypothetical protein
MVRNVTFGQDSGYVGVPVGDAQLEVRLAGREQTVLTVSASFADGYAYTLVATGLAGGPGLAY